MGIGLLVTGALLQLYLPSMWLFLQQNDLAQAQQQTVVALDRIRGGLLNTLPETVSVQASLKGLAWRPQDPNTPFDPLGNPLLANQFAVYWWDPPSGKLFSLDHSPPGYPWSPPGPLADAGFPAPSPACRVVALNVSNFKAGPLAFPLPLEITVSPPKTRHTPSWTLRTRVMPRVGGSLPTP